MYKRINYLNYDDITFQYYPSNVKITKPIGEVTLSQFLSSHRNPKPKMKDVFDRLSVAEGEVKDKIKQTELFYFTPCVKIEDSRCYNNVVGFTQLMIVEFDKLGKEEAVKLKYKIFYSFQSCICAYLSPSGRGCKFFFAIPLCYDVSEFKSYFCGIASELSVFEGFDGTAVSPVLPLFISYDSDILVRDESEIIPWTIKGINEKSIENKEYSELEPLENVTEEDVKKILGFVDAAFVNIEKMQEGHSRVRSIGLTLGGYVGAGYLSEEEAEEYIHTKIEESDYCSKGVSGYKTTASNFIKQGILRPLLLDIKESQHTLVVG